MRIGKPTSISQYLSLHQCAKALTHKLINIHKWNGACNKHDGLGRSWPCKIKLPSFVWFSSNRISDIANPATGDRGTAGPRSNCSIGPGVWLTWAAGFQPSWIWVCGLWHHSNYIYPPVIKSAHGNLYVYMFICLSIYLSISLSLASSPSLGVQSYIYIILLNIITVLHVYIYT